MFIRVILLSLILMVFGCTPDEGDKEVVSLAPNSSANRIYILNEGNYNWNNASVSVIDLEQKTVFNQQFEAANGYVIGDVLQSAIVSDSSLFFSVNNSGKIIETDFSLNEIQTTTVHSPRYLAEQGGSIYSSNIYKNEIDVINKLNGQLEPGIQTTGWTEYLRVDHIRLFAAAKNPNGIWKITLQDQSSQFIPLPDSLSITGLAFRESNLLVGTDDGIYEYTSSNELIRVLENVKTFRFSYNEATQSCYWLDSGINQYHLIDSTQSVVISKNWNNAYGLGIDENGVRAVVCDAKDYQQKGSVLVYNLENQTLESEFEVGVIPQFVLFKP